jgi:hypothetical protein
MNIPATFQKVQGNINLRDTQLSFNDVLVLPFTAIKAQFVNVVKEGGKIILKLELFDSTKVSFLFSCLHDRDVVKNYISTKSSNSSNDEIYKEVLNSNSKLLNNHKNWVQSGLLKESEFWITLDKQVKEYEFLKNLKTPPSSLLLSDLKPQGDGENDLKYTLNPEIIHSIFTTYPAVLKAYQENVPLKLSEVEFWTKYFSSQYYYRKKMGLESKTKIKGDIFDLYSELDELDLQVNASNLEFHSSNNLLDLTSTDQDHASSGNRKDLTMRHGSLKESLGLIRRFNRHSDMVLKAIKYVPCHNNSSKASNSSEARVIIDFKKRKKKKEKRRKT